MGSELLTGSVGRVNRYWTSPAQALLVPGPGMTPVLLCPVTVGVMKLKLINTISVIPVLMSCTSIDFDVSDGYTASIFQVDIVLNKQEEGSKNILATLKV
jgi:hypothetical protein